MKHSFPPLIHSSSRILILGTMPSEKSLECRQYYGNKQNHFWKILYSVFQRDFSDDYLDRQKLVMECDLALWDVLKHCEREGSLDSKIKMEEPNDIGELLEEYPGIKTIVFSSKNAEKFYAKYFKKTTGVAYLTLASPSGAYATISLKEKIENWKKISQL